ncbi:MAG: hypothetical protein AB7I41_24460 [Candidatus Sericytochromatia bacterium]
MPNPITSLSHVDKIHPRWRPLLDQLTAAAQGYFGPELKAVYLLGSISRGQEHIGSSDLDLELVISHKASEADKNWAEKLAEQTLADWPDLLKIDLDLLFAEVLQAPESQRLRFIFASDGLRLWGEDCLPESESWSPGPELAYLLNHHFRWARAETLKMLQDSGDVAEYTHWISKQALRLGLGLAMCQQPVYTRTVAEMPELIARVLPELATLMHSILVMYQAPTTQRETALAFVQSLAPLYLLAEQRWPESSAKA